MGDSYSQSQSYSEDRTKLEEIKDEKMAVEAPGSRPETRGNGQKKSFSRE